MSTFDPAPGYPRVRIVRSFEDLLATPFADGVNALCWPRDLPGDFGEVLAQLPPGDGIRGIDEAELAALTLGPAGSLARDALLDDLRRLRDAERDPVLNRIDAYPRDEEPGPVATDVMSFHADSAPVEADTWLCTYHGACSEGLRNEEARRKIDDPAIRAALLAEFGGDDDGAFAEYLADACYDLHYAPLPGARPFAFGTGHLWRIAVDWPGNPVPPCVHRAPDTSPGDPPRLLLIC